MPDEIPFECHHERPVAHHHPFRQAAELCRRWPASARHAATLGADAGGARARGRAARDVVEAAIAAGLPVYGSTTGVGAMKDVEWTARRARNLQSRPGARPPFRHRRAVPQFGRAQRHGDPRQHGADRPRRLHHRSGRGLSGAARRRRGAGGAPHRLDRLRRYRADGPDRRRADRRRRGGLSRTAACRPPRRWPRPASSRSRMAPRDSLASISVNAVGFAAAAEAIARRRRRRAHAARHRPHHRRRARRLARSVEGGGPCRHRARGRDRRLALSQRHGLGLAQRHPYPGPAEPAHDGAGVRHRRSKRCWSAGQHHARRHRPHRRQSGGGRGRRC